MTNDIGNIIIDKIKTLPFIDKYAGVVKILSYKSESKDKKFTQKKFPASCQTTFEQCKDESRYMDLCPDSKKKSVLYLEDNGVRFIKREGSKITWKASYNLVCWLNMPKLGFNDCSYSTTAIASIMKQFPVTPFNDGIFTFIKINPIGQQPSSQNPFSKYSYDESVSQMLMYPFDYFVLLIDVDFITDQRCLEITPLNPDSSCENQSS